MVVFLSITISRELWFEYGKRNLLVVVAQSAPFREHASRGCGLFVGSDASLVGSDTWMIFAPTPVLVCMRADCVD